MKSFEEFLVKLLDKPSTETVIKVRGKEKKIKGMAKFTSKNMNGEHYFKLSFVDGSNMVVSPSSQEIYVGDGGPEKAQGIGDELIGRVEALSYEGRKYQLDNKDDYQYCLELLVGRPGIDIEGECRFSDYVTKDEPVSILSLGWLSDTNKRADVLVTKIDISEVEVL